MFKLASYSIAFWEIEIITLIRFNLNSKDLHKPTLIQLTVENNRYGCRGYDQKGNTI